MIRIMLVLAAAAAALALAVSATGAPTATTLAGTTGPGFTITLKKTGKMVKTLRPGKYTIRVSDRSSSHNFRIKGPGVNKQITTLGFTGTRSATVTLKRGKYTYQCDPHVTQGMKHTFTVK